VRKNSSGLISEDKVVLATDMYQLTMGRGYYELDKQDEIATFNLFTRRLPKNRSYLVVAGLEQALWYVTEGMRFDDDSIEFLKGKKQFANAKKEFWDYLKDFRFTGDVWAMPEGEIAFQQEPMMRVTAPIIEAQLAETYLLSQYNHQTKVASKAARCVEASQGRPVIEFGTRRTDPGAAVRGARAAYIAGTIGTSNVLADYMFGVPSFGTHAHSWVMSFVAEQEAFDAYFKIYGEDSLFLIDTYNTRTGAKRAAKMEGKIKGVRLDSYIDLDDFTKQSIDVREILDAAGKKDGAIFASSDLNEYKISDMLKRGAKIDVFCPGTEVILSVDSPSLSGVYKLAHLNNESKLKMSVGKASYPGKQQVYRSDGFDTLALEGEKAEGRPLLRKCVSAGKLVEELPTIHESREYATRNLKSLPLELRRIDEAVPYEVKISDELGSLTERLKWAYGKEATV